MVNMEKSYVSLVIYDFDDPAEITRVMQCEPDSVELINEKRSVGTYPNVVYLKNHQNTWSISSKSTIDESRLLDDHIDVITEIINKKKDNLLQVKEQFKLQLSLVTYVESANIGILIEPKLLKLLSDLDCSLDIDSYCIA